MDRQGRLCTLEDIGDAFGANGDVCYGQLDRLVLYFLGHIQSLLQPVSGRYD